MVLAFGPFELDVAACELRRDGRSVPLQPRVFDTLRYLVEHRDRLVAKQELIDALWGGQQLNAVAVPWSISHARKALNQQGNEDKYIETVRGRGYRFVAEVREVSARTATAAVAAITAPESEAAAAPPARASDPFVGREQVMQQLMAALEVSRGGHGRLVLLSGEAGIGKTRCMAELSTLARERGFSVWSGRCLDGAAPAFWPFIQVLRDACADPRVAERDRCEAEVLLSQLVPDPNAAPAPETASESDDARFWLLDRVSRFFLRDAEQLRIITIDDLHWADENSLRALALLAPLLERSQLLVIGTARDTASDPERGAVPLSLRLRPCERVALGGLLVSDVASYLATILGEPPTEELSHAVHARTAGNPLFVAEAVRLVSAEHSRKGAVRAADVPLPEAAKGFMSDRLAKLGSTTRAVLDVCCVIGDEIELPVLQRASGLEAEPLLASLQEAESVRIVERRADALRYAFVHPLMREVLYAALTTGQRAQRHAEVGLALETLAVIEPRHNQLAYHFHLAPGGEHYERAVRYGKLAGDGAMRVYAYDEAAQFYGWALEAQPFREPQDTRATCELLLASAAALLRSGQRQAWRQQCKQAITLARQAGLAEVLVQAATQLRPSVTSAVVPDGLVVGALEEALARLPESAVSSRALAYARLASIPPHAMQLERSRELSDEAVRLARASGDRAILLEALRSRFRSLSGPDSMDELLRVADEILEADPHSASGWSADAVIIRYQVHLRRGDVTAAERALATFGRMARELRARDWQWHHDRMVAQRALQAGRVDEAERQFNELWAQSQRLHLPYGAMLYAAQLNALSIERTGRRLAASAPDTGSDPWKWAQDIPTYRTERILLAIQYGEIDSARAMFRGLAANKFAALTRDSNFLFAGVRLALAAISLREPEAAADLYEILAPYADLFAVSDFAFSLGCVAHYLGLLARFLEQRTEARAHLLHAIDRNLGTHHELRGLRSRLALAELLAESRSRQERAEALALASDVRAGAQRYGMNELRASAVVVAERLSAAGNARFARASLQRTRTLTKAIDKRRLRFR